MDSIHEKIRRLLSLADNAAATPAEASLAMDRAMRLARAHAIDIASVRAQGEPEPPIGHRMVDLPTRVSFNRRMAIGAACRFFNVNAVISHPCLVLIGTESDIAIAEYAIEFMRAAASRALSAHVGRRRLADSTKKSFVMGFYHAVSANMEKSIIEERAKAVTGLELSVTTDHRAAERLAYRDKLFPPQDLKSVKSGKPERYNSAAGWRGVIAGNDTHVRPAINGGNGKAAEPLLIGGGS